VQEQKDLREVLRTQIENTVLKADKEPLREEAAKHSKAIKEFKAAVAAAKQEQWWRWPPSSPQRPTSSGETENPVGQHRPRTNQEGPMDKPPW
jgi:hypothetical protein